MAQKVASRKYESFVEQVRQKMPFERCVQHQPVKCGVVAERADNLDRQVAEQPRVVTCIDEGLQLRDPPVGAVLVFPGVQNGMVEIFFRGEMPK